MAALTTASHSSIVGRNAGYERGHSKYIRAFDEKIYKLL